MSESGEPGILYTYDLAGNMLSEVHTTAIDLSTPESFDNPVLDYVYLGNHRIAVLTGQMDLGENPPECFIATAAGTSSLHPFTGPHASLAARVGQVWSGFAPIGATEIDALRMFRDKVLKSFSVGMAFVDWYYKVGPNGAAWLNGHAGWKPVVRVGLALPIAVSKWAVNARWYHGAGLALAVCFAGFAALRAKKSSWCKGKRVLAVFVVAIGIISVYFIIMSPQPARADFERPETQLVSGNVFFFYEDHIGRPVLVSERDDYTPVGETPDGSYFKRWDQSGPIWQVVYDPYGQVGEDHDSSGLNVGDPGYTGITWSVPFRFPGQYQDSNSLLYNRIYYNWNRYYMPNVGRYNRADPMGKYPNVSPLKLNNYMYAFNAPNKFIDVTGLSACTDNCELGYRFCMSSVYNTWKNQERGIAMWESECKSNCDTMDTEDAGKMLCWQGCESLTGAMQQANWLAFGNLMHGCTTRQTVCLLGCKLLDKCPRPKCWGYGCQNWPPEFRL